MATIKELEDRMLSIEKGVSVKYLCQINELQIRVDALSKELALAKDNYSKDLDGRIKEVLASNADNTDVVIYAPKKVNVVPGVINAIIDWSGVEGAKKYFVYYNAMGANPIRIGPTTNTSTTIPRLQQNTEYEVFVRSGVGSHLSQPSAALKFKTKNLN